MSVFKNHAANLVNEYHRSCQKLSKKKKNKKKKKQEAHGPRLAHLSDITTAAMQMLCNIFPILSSQQQDQCEIWGKLAKWFLKNHDFIHVNSTVAGKYNKYKQDDGHLRFPIRTILITRL